MGGRWRVDTLVGTGGMANVYAAREGSQWSAVKIMRADCASNPRLVSQFEVEGRVMARLSHPNIVSVDVAGTLDDGTPYLVMELLRGVPLDRLTQQRGALPVDEALIIIDQVLDALALCHSNDIVHRDLKPANVFVTQEGVVKLLDFGVARVPGEPDAAELSGSRLGTPAFMSPEQALNASVGLDGRSDIFAVGATLYALLSGKRIRDTDEGDEAFIMAATTPPSSLARAAPRLPLSVIRLVDRALAWSPGDRFQTVEEMSDAVRATLEVGTEAQDASARDERRASLKQSLGNVVARDDEALDPDTHKEKARALRELFRLTGAVFGTANQYAWEHDQTQSRRRALFESLTAMLAVWPAGLGWIVRPYGFDFGGESVWEPGSGTDDVPYNLFSSGYRTIRFVPGVTADELDEFLQLMQTDPVNGLPPEDDLGTVFVERGFPHIVVQLVTAFDMDLLRDHLDLQSQLAQLRAEIAGQVQADFDDRASVAGLVAEVGEAGLKEADAIAISFEAGALEQLATGQARLVSEERVRDYARRFTDEADAVDDRTWRVLAEGVVDGLQRGDLELVEEPFVELVAEYVEAGASAKLIELTGGMLHYLPDEAVGPFIGALYTPAALSLLGRAMIAEASRGAEAVGCGAIVAAVVSHAPRACYPAILRLFADTFGTLTAEALRGRVERDAAGNEASLGEVLERAPLALANELIPLLAGSDREQQAHRALQRAAKNPAPAVRLAALPHLLTQPSEGVLAEIVTLASHKQPDVRMSTIKTLSDFRVTVAGPRLLPILASDELHDRPLLERQALLKYLFTASPLETERAAAELTRRAGLFGDKKTDPTRVLAIQLLGEYGTTSVSVEAATACLGRAWWNPRELREAATVALDRLQARGVKG
ncbi:MAG: protein kinase [Myxococcales bacterium]|nr:protein kinase [Myxococcales bacterium]MCB9534000.1 protein kinase [Myxococcales bacterium]